MKANDMVYTQYCPMSVFIYSSSLLAPFRFRWFHLQTFEMVLFMTITIADVVFYWVIVLRQFLPMNFLFFESVCCWLYLIIGGFTLFQVVTAHSRWFQLVPGSSTILVIIFWGILMFDKIFHVTTSETNRNY